LRLAKAGVNLRLGKTGIVENRRGLCHWSVCGPRPRDDAIGRLLMPDLGELIDQRDYRSVVRSGRNA